MWSFSTVLSTPLSDTEPIGDIRNERGLLKYLTTSLKSWFYLHLIISSHILMFIFSETHFLKLVFKFKRELRYNSKCNVMQDPSLNLGMERKKPIEDIMIEDYMTSRN